MTATCGQLTKQYWTLVPAGGGRYQFYSLWAAEDLEWTSQGCMYDFGVGNDIQIGPVAGNGSLWYWNAA